MTWQSPLIVALLACGVGVVLLCCLGLLLMLSEFLVQTLRIRARRKE